LEKDSEDVIDYRDKSIFDKRKVESNAIDYQLQSIVPTYISTFVLNTFVPSKPNFHQNLEQDG